MKTTRRRLAAWFVVSAACLAAAVALAGPLLPWLNRARPHAGPTGVFEVAPYLQAGDDSDGLALLWQAADGDSAWGVELRSGPDGPWAAASPPSSRRVAVDGVPPFRVYRAELAPLAPGAEFAYRVRLAGVPVFEARGRARPAAGRPHRFVVFGDCAAGTRAQAAVAYQAYRARPDYVVVTGDVVYSRGRVAEYLDHFFPVYNREEASPGSGAPLLRSTLFLAAPGNHDLIERDLDKVPDGLAFFYYWAQPRNGPAVAPGAWGTPALKGSAARRRAFLDGAGPDFPRGANFSLDCGDVHWTVLDANTYADWSAPAFRDWLDADLAAARKARWRLVALHHPPFHSSKAHADDQRMRLLAPAFERGKVAVVFSGHVHNYQRSHPLRFAPDPPPADGLGRPYGPKGQLGGAWALDTAYDGATRTRPDGVLYVVTGAGGARLYDTDRHGRPASWQPFTARFVSDVHSLTVADVTPEALTIRQVSDSGEELDRFVVSRADGPEVEATEH